MPRDITESNDVSRFQDERRLILGTLMTHGTDTVLLRERALDQVILAALLGSSPDAPFKNGDIQKNLSSGMSAIHLRPEVIGETLIRLENAGLVNQAEDRMKRVYYTTDKGSELLSKRSGEAVSLLEPVLDEVLLHADEQIDRGAARALFADFICTSFARFGSSLAAYLTGRYARLGNSTELAITFDQCAEKSTITAGQRQSLRIRFVDAFRSKSIPAQRMMLHLTQGFCFAQLLGIENRGFNPLAEKAFDGSIFYLDTNVLFIGLLPGDRGEGFAEVLGIARRGGCELRVTRATLDETRFTSAEKTKMLNAIANEIPEAVGELSSDEFVSNYYEAKQSNPSLTPNQFMADFDAIADVVRDKWGLTVEERTEETLLQNVDTRRFSEAIQDAAQHSRGYPKNEHVLRHDIAHLLLIRQVRAENSLTWFLTRDRAMINAAEEISAQSSPFERPLCFGLLGFLQSISPFVRSTNEDDLVAHFFGSLLSEQVFISEKLFDGKELELMVRTHADVMALPPEQVVVAADYVKRHILKGERYRAENVAFVALELRKLLSSDANEREKALEAAAAEKDTQYRLTKQELIESQQRKAESDTLLQQNATLLAEKDQEISLLQNEKDRVERRSKNLKRALVVVGFVVCAVGLKHYSPFIVEFLRSRLLIDSKNVANMLIAIRVVDAGLLIAPWLYVARSSRLSIRVRDGLTAVGIVVLFYVAGVQHSDGFGVISNLLTLGLAVTLFIQGESSGKK